MKERKGVGARADAIGEDLVLLGLGIGHCLRLPVKVDHPLVCCLAVDAICACTSASRGKSSGSEIAGQEICDGPAHCSICLAATVTGAM